MDKKIKLNVTQTELTEEDMKLLNDFLSRSRKMLEDAGGFKDEQHLETVLRFMESTFLEDLKEEKKKK